MKCPIDQTEMEKGFMGTQGYVFWSSGDKPRGVFQVMLGRKTKFIVAYKCPKCGKLEFYTETETK